MKLQLLVLALVLGIATACGGGDKSSSADPTSTRASERTAVAPEDATSTSEPEETPGVTGDGDTGGSIGKLFSSVFSNGLSGGTGSGLNSGDEALKAYLPSSDDLPDGFSEFGVFTFSSPSTFGGGGTMDMAAQMAMKGDITSGDPTDVEMLMSMVIHPDDLQELGEAFDEIKNLDPDEIEDEIAAGLEGGEAFGIASFNVLPADDLGEGGFGMEMTMDLSQLGALFGAAGEGEEMPKITMRMYIFGRGDYIGATMHMAFADSLGDEGELDLARIIDDKLQGAP